MMRRFKNTETLARWLSVEGHSVKVEAGQAVLLDVAEDAKEVWETAFTVGIPSTETVEAVEEAITMAVEPADAPSPTPRSRKRNAFFG